MSLRFLRIVPVFGLCAFLAGCGVSSSMMHVAGTDMAVSGHVHGGQQPVSGATIQLYTVGVTGDGSASTPILSQTVTTDAGGNFSITNLYSCAGATQVYLTATGGSPGTAAPNPNLALMTALGTCSALPSVSFISVNEATTVAAVSALSPYMSSLSAVGSGKADAAALTSAFALASEYVDPSLGTSPGNNVPTGYTVPTTLINTLADVLASCINSTGGTAGDTSLCGQFFMMTTVPGAAAPANTIAALLNLANNPTLNTAGLYALASPAAPFQPQVTAAPASFVVRMSTSVAPTGLQMTPVSLTFPASTIGAVSAAQTVTLKYSGNTGTSVALGSMQIVGANASDFTVVNNCGASLVANYTCTVQVKATPGALGLRSAYLSIASSSPQSPQFIALATAGTASGANLATLSTNSIAFTFLNASYDVTLSNYGSTAIPIGTIAITDPNFNQTNNCNGSLPAQSICTVTVQSTGFGNTATTTVPTPYGGSLVINEGTAGAQTVALSSANAYTYQGAESYTYFIQPTILSLPITVQVPFNQTTTEFLMNFNAYIGTYCSVVPTFAGANASDFSYLTTGSFGPVAGLTSCEIKFNFKPGAAGTRNARAVLDSTGQYYPVIGTGLTGPVFFLPQTSAEFDLTVANDNTASSSTQVSLDNIGTSAVNLSFGAFTGANASDFAQSPSYVPCSVIAAPANGIPVVGCGLNVTFSTKTGVGSYSATLPITELDTNTVYDFTVLGTVVYAPYTVSTSVDFYTVNGQPIGTSSAVQNLGITNPYTHTMKATLQPSSNFTFPNGPLCTVATVNGTCYIGIAFSPQTAGQSTETMTITDTTTGVAKAVTLTGNGGEGSLSASPSPLTFATRSVNTTSLPIPITLTNTGPVSVTFSSITLTGAVQNNFVQTNNCGTYILANGGTCTFNVTFAPTATGTQNATITVTPYPQVPVLTIPISGTAQ